MTSEAKQSLVNPAFQAGGYRELFQVAWPLIISMGSFTLMQFCDRMFLAWHSPVSLQAVLPSGMLAFTMISGLMAIANYANTFVAQYFGANDLEGCSRSTAQGVFLALFSFPIYLALIPLGWFVLDHVGHPAPVVAEEKVYYAIMMVGGVGISLWGAISSFYTGRGLTRVTMVANIIGNGLNIVLDYAMIFGKWGFPEWGIRGAAWATVIAGFVGPGILFVLYFSRKNHRQFSTRTTFYFDRRLFKRLIRFGFPSGMHLMLDVAAFSVFILFTGRMGELALTASNLALSINNIAFMPLIGISIATSTLVGQYQGQGASALAARSTITAVKVATLYITLIGLTFVLFPRFYFSLFTEYGGADLSLEALLPMGRWLLVIMALWGVIDASHLVLSGALKGAGDTKFVMYYSLAMAWGVLVGGLIVIVLVLDLGIYWAWGWTAFYIFVLSLGYMLRFKQGAWKTMEVIDRESPVEPRAPGGEAFVVVD